MISPFAKRSLSVLLSSQLALSPVMSAPNPDIDDAVKRITPQRAIPYHFNALGRDTAFKEYFLSPLGHECAFKAFNTTRQNAVALIEEKINAGSMETIRLLDKAIETDVLNQEIRNLFHDGMGAAEKRQRYLTHYKTTTTMVECHQNEGADATLNTVSLLDVLSYVYRLDLRVYISQENASHSLQLFHKRSLQESKGVVRLLLKNSHYNLLLRDTDPHMLHVKASAKEETYLHEYRAKLTQDAQETQRALAQLRHDENSMEDVEFSCDTPTPSSPTLLSSNTRRAPSVSEETVVQPRAVRSTQASFPHRSIVDFLNRKTNRLPGKTYDGSRTSIWQSAKDLSEKTPSTRLQKTTNLINASLYQSALVLDHRFVPTPQTKQATLNEIKKTLQTALQHARQNQQQLGRHYNAALHHMAVYLGRCFAILGDHDLAWQTLSSTLSDGYTRSATLEMARLVLEEGYKPQDMVGALTPETYALSLLDKTHTPRANTTLRKSKAGGTREQMTFVHTPYLNSKEGRAFAKTLKAIAKERQGRARRTVSHDENSPRLSAVLCSRSQAPTQSSQGARASVLFPSPPASRASSVTVRDKRSYEAFLADNGGIVTERLEPRPKRMMTSRDESDEEDTSCSSESDDRLTISHVSEDEEMLDASHAAAFADEAFTDPDEDEEIASALAFTATPVSHFTIQDVEELLLRAGISGAHGDDQQAQGFCFNALEKLQTLNAPHLQAKAFYLLGNARFEGMIGDQLYKETDCYLEGLRLATGIQDQKLMAQALIGLGNNKFEGDIAGQRYTGQDCYREGLDLARNAGDHKLMAQALIGLGNNQFEGLIDGQHRTRIDCYRESLDLARNAGDPKLMAQALIGLGNNQFEGDIAGQRYTGQDCYREGLDLARNAGDPKLMAQALIGLGNTQFEGLIDGQHRTRIDCYRESLDLARKAGDQKLMAQALIGLGNAQFEGRIDGQPHTWQDCYLKGLDLARKARDHKLMAQALIGLGNNKFEGDIAGQRYTGQDCYREGLDLARKARDHKLMAQAHLGLGNAYCAQRNNAKGLEHFEQARTMAQRLGNNLLIQKANNGIARAKKFLSQNSHQRSARPSHKH